MSEQVITTRRGIYGRVNITLPLHIKTAMLAWAKESGMRKAEFLRLALTTGFLVLSRGIQSGGLESGGDYCRGDRKRERGRAANAAHPLY